MTTLKLNYDPYKKLKNEKIHNEYVGFEFMTYIQKCAKT